MLDWMARDRLGMSLCIEQWDETVIMTLDAFDNMAFWRIFPPFPVTG